MGILLELGPQRNLGCDYLVGVRGLPAYAHHSRMARPPRGLLCHPRLRGCHVHVLRRHLLVARTTRLCLAPQSSRQKQDCPAGNSLSSGLRISAWVPCASIGSSKQSCLSASCSWRGCCSSPLRRSLCGIPSAMPS